MNETILVLCVLVLVPAFIVALMYNSLVNRRNQVRYAFASIDVQLKKRFDLIPNLVEVVKGFAAHEKQTLEAVTQARTQASRKGATWQDQEMLAHASKSLIAVAEAYPDLKSDRQFLFLQRSLSECEEQIAAARRAYNASVMDYQNAIGMFPSSIIASLFRFTPMPSFEAAIEERENINVRF